MFDPELGSLSFYFNSRQNTGSHCRLVKVKDRESTVCRAATLDILTG